MKVKWEYYSQYMESHKIHVPNHQPVEQLDGEMVKYKRWLMYKNQSVGPAQLVEAQKQRRLNSLPWFYWIAGESHSHLGFFYPFHPNMVIS